MTQELLDKTTLRFYCPSFMKQVLKSVCSLMCPHDIAMVIMYNVVDPWPLE